MNIILVFVVVFLSPQLRPFRVSIAALLLVVVVRILSGIALHFFNGKKKKRENQLLASSNTSYDVITVRSRREKKERGRKK